MVKVFILYDIALQKTTENWNEVELRYRIQAAGSSLSKIESCIELPTTASSIYTIVGFYFLELR